MEIGEFETFNELAPQSLCGTSECTLVLGEELADPSAARRAERCCSSLTAPSTESGACIPADHVCCGCSQEMCCACPRDPNHPHAAPKCLASCRITSDLPGADCSGCCPSPPLTAAFASSPTSSFAVAALACLAIFVSYRACTRSSTTAHSHAKPDIGRTA
ncbi:uncharacterized protein AMSG_00220 [Thecamonas trahens ATCC 50062]|uniref:Uncharacterized protein n=1 Tax=Thecamonas trahens ATCC 50062 TaxID=461836 RepID=A0A0L0D486_THETB|nr:hypothetical protein AMSG_00220 [Thecamonas trahens ATCC 50062]KNC46103.1 hypothetical protein AMSG_00220 [Thecamonas trahens ATCC 50062]|eukprot:XP_013763081.1 hypothetical protein AMSG_00220 [Thecamonas trahens ATCC 50062]